VRGALRRDAITQAIDYASSIAELPMAELHDKLKPYLASKNLDLRHLFDDRRADKSREVLIFIVGNGRDSGRRPRAFEDASKFLLWRDSDWHPCVRRSSRRRRGWCRWRC
jgi:hypothetical protein